MFQNKKQSWRRQRPVSLNSCNSLASDGCYFSSLFIMVSKRSYPPKELQARCRGTGPTLTHEAHTQTHTFVSTRTHTHTQKNTHTHTHTHTQTHTHTHTHTQTPRHSQAQTN